MRAVVALPLSTKRRVRFGALLRKMRIERDFDAPLPPEVAAAFEGVGAHSSSTSRSRPTR